MSNLNAQNTPFKKGFKKRQHNSPLPSHRNHRIRIPLLIHLLLHITTKTNRTHDPIPKLLIHHGLIRVAIVLHDLVQSVYQRFHRRHGAGASAVGEAEELAAQHGFRDAKDGGELGDVGGVGAGLAVEQGGDEDLAASEGAGDGGEGQGARGLGVKEGFGGEGEA